MDPFIRTLPKAELHLHIEGTLEPEMLFSLAKRNGAALGYASVDELRAAYDFTDLQSFLDIYYEGAAVLRTEQDFHDLTWAYLQRAARDGVRRAEIFFDPQTHIERGVAMGTVIDGISSALDRGPEIGINGGLIMCFLRHLPESSALETLEAALPHRSRLLGVGLDSSELGHPPTEFTAVFNLARQEGLHLVAHAGEEGPPDYVWQALDVLGVERIDHGVRAIEDDALVARLAADRIPLTMCPLSNLKLKVVDNLAHHPLRRLLHSGVKVTINSDDPAYFGGYLGDNYSAITSALGLEREELVDLARHSLEAAFLPETDPVFADFEHQVGASRLIDWSMDLNITPAAIALVRKKGGVMAIDFIPPISWGGTLEVSVDTYLKGKDLSPYQQLTVDDVELHVSPALSTWADHATVAVRSTRLGKKLEVLADHKHQPTWTH